MPPDKAFSAKPSTSSSALFNELEEALPENKKKLLHEALAAQSMEQMSEAQKKLDSSPCTLWADPTPSSK
jgi:hypothetical protein